MRIPNNSSRPVQLACFLALRCVGVFVALTLVDSAQGKVDRLRELMKSFFIRSPRFSIALGCLRESGGSDFKIGAQVAQQFVVEQHAATIDPLKRAEERAK